MGQGIDPGQCGDFGGLGQGEQGIQDGDRRGGFGIAASHFDVGFRIAYQGKRLGFAPGARGGRNGDQREHRFACFSYSPVIRNDAAAGIEEIDPFSAVHARPSSESDDQIWGPLAGYFQTLVDVEGVWIFAQTVESANLQS